MALIKQFSPEAYKELQSMENRQAYIDRLESGTYDEETLSQVPSIAKSPLIRSLLTRKQQGICQRLQTGSCPKDIAKALGMTTRGVNDAIGRIRSTLKELYDACEDKSKFSWLYP